MEKITYTIVYHPDVVKKDIPRISSAIKPRIRMAIERKLGSVPHLFGEPLQKSLSGYRKLRVGNYRVIYEIQKKTVIIYVIGHRRDVYTRAETRL